MRILLLAPHPFVTERGTPIAVAEIARGLADLNHAVDVVTYHLGTDLQHPGVTVHRIARPAGIAHVPIGPSWQKAICDIALYRLAKKLLRNTRYDLIHAVEEAAFFACHLGRQFDLPYVYDMDSQMSSQIREKSALLTPAAWVFDRLERRAIARSAGVLAVCPALLDWAKPLHPHGRVHLLPDMPLGINPNDDDGGALPDAITQPGGVKLMYVGNLEHYQGVDLLIEAFTQAHVADEASLIIVGGDDASIAAAKSRAAAHQWERSVHFAGPVPVGRLGRVLQAADVLVSPRLKGQNTPMKIYSYLQSGRAVLATDLPTHTQVLDRNVAALADPTPDALAQAIRSLVCGDSAQTQRAALGQAGQALIQREYTPARYRERLATFYTEITADGATPSAPRETP